LRFVEDMLRKEVIDLVTKSGEQVLVVSSDAGWLGLDVLHYRQTRRNFSDGLII